MFYSINPYRILLDVLMVGLIVFTSHGVLVQFTKATDFQASEKNDV